MALDKDILTYLESRIRAEIANLPRGTQFSAPWVPEPSAVMSIRVHFSSVSVLDEFVGWAADKTRILTYDTTVEIAVTGKNTAILDELRSGIPQYMADSGHAEYPEMISGNKRPQFVTRTIEQLDDLSHQFTLTYQASPLLLDAVT